LTVAKAPPGQYGRVIATLGDLKGEAEVRVAPKPPYKPDLSKVPVGRTPAGWVNTQGKFLIKEVGGEHLLSKRNDVGSPLVYKANGYIGTPDMHDYTIEADIQGVAVRDIRPDFGVIANRYTLWISGNTQQLRLTSWDALPRVDKTISFKWDAGAWYHFKLTVEVNGNKAVARGKVWEAGKPEPKEWTVEVEDDTPNREGAPAIFGTSHGVEDNAPGSEIYYRNISVTPNKR
jgi:hypothetical protein